MLAGSDGMAHQKAVRGHSQGDDVQITEGVTARRQSRRQRRLRIARQNQGEGRGSTGPSSTAKGRSSDETKPGQRLRRRGMQAEK